MPRKAKQTAHAELDKLRQRAVAERVKARDLEVQLEAAKAKVDSASGYIIAAYEDEDERAVEAARRDLKAAEADVADLGHRVAAAQHRIDRAQRAVDAFTQEHARGLLSEREQPARTIAAELTAAAHELLRLHRANLAERQTVDQLVPSVPGATPRTDGPAAAHPWEPQLQALARSVSEYLRSLPHCRDGRALSTAGKRTTPPVVFSFNGVRS